MVFGDWFYFDNYMYIVYVYCLYVKKVKIEVYFKYKFIFQKCFVFYLKFKYEFYKCYKCIMWCMLNRLNLFS